MSSAPLASLRVKGFASVSDTTVELSSDVTLLIGPNGSGKSNIVGAFELLGRIVDGQLQDYLLRRGGFAAALHRSKRPEDSVDVVELVALGTAVDGLVNGYQATLAGRSSDTAMLSEATLFHDQAKYPRPHHSHLSSGRESVLSDPAVRQGRAFYAYSVLEGCRVFHFDDVSQNAPPKTTTSIVDNVTLAPDAGNLAALLLHLSESQPHGYARIVRAVRTVAPYFDDFVLRPTGENVLLRWREKGLDRVFSANDLSDGTLRFVCLATLLLQPEPPRTIVLDEPELGLHPFAVHQLAGLLRSASTGRRIVAATQSTTLLSEFDASEVAVVERAADGSQVRRLNADALSEWLDLYSLGELWEKNLLGGRPKVDGPTGAVSA